ncbi:hypothetical protein N0V90_002859 [Kalmusia sp. IMI 367209]|nr:hypothetical protein N0V90_002859 [Kalmusia sp. IMI 367209]
MGVQGCIDALSYTKALKIRLVSEDDSWRLIQPDLFDEDSAGTESQPALQVFSPTPSNQVDIPLEFQFETHESLSQHWNPANDANAFDLNFIDDSISYVGLGTSATPHSILDAEHFIHLPLQPDDQPIPNVDNPDIDQLAAWPPNRSAETFPSDDRFAQEALHQCIHESPLTSVFKQNAMSLVSRSLPFNSDVPCEVSQPNSKTIQPQESTYDVGINLHPNPGGCTIAASTAQALAYHESSAQSLGQVPPRMEPQSMINTPFHSKTPAYDGLFQSYTDSGDGLGYIGSILPSTNEFQRQTAPNSLTYGANYLQTLEQPNAQQLAAHENHISANIAYPQAPPAITQHQIDVGPNQTFDPLTYSHESVDDLRGKTHVVPYGLNDLGDVPMIIDNTNALTTTPSNANFSNTLGSIAVTDTPSFTSGTTVSPLYLQQQSSTDAAQSEYQVTRQGVSKASCHRAKRRKSATPTIGMKQQLALVHQLAKTKGVPEGSSHVLEFMCSRQNQKRRRTSEQRENKKNVEMIGGSCMRCKNLRLKCSDKRPCGNCTKYWSDRVGKSTNFRWTCDNRLKLSDIDLFTKPLSFAPGSHYTPGTVDSKTEVHAKDALKIFIEKIDSFHPVIALIDMIEKRQLRQAMMAWERPSMFVFYSYLQSMLRWKKVISTRYEKDFEHALGTIEGVHRYLNLRLRKLFDDTKRCHPHEELHHLFYYTLFFEDTVKLGDIEGVKTPGHEALVEIMQSQLRLFLARRYSSKKAASQMDSKPYGELLLLCTVDCLRPCVLPSQREEPISHLPEFQIHVASDEYRKNRGIEVDLFNIHQSGCCTNWMVSYIPNSLFWIFKIFPEIVCELLHDGTRPVNILNNHLSQMTKLSIPLTPASFSSDIELSNAYALWLAFQLTAREIFKAFVEEPSAFTQMVARMEIFNFSNCAARLRSLEIIITFSVMVFDEYNACAPGIRELCLNGFDNVDELGRISCIMEILVQDVMKDILVPRLLDGLADTDELSPEATSRVTNEARV